MMAYTCTAGTEEATPEGSCFWEQPELYAMKLSNNNNSEEQPGQENQLKFEDSL